MFQTTGLDLETRHQTSTLPDLRLSPGGPKLDLCLMNKIGPRYPWPAGSATGVGSMPGTNPAEAMRVIVGELPDFPYLPELPDRGSRRGPHRPDGRPADRHPRRGQPARLAAGRAARP